MASREKKGQAIDRIQEKLSKASVSVVTDYRGLTAGDMTELRRKLRESGIEYQVVKNTMARFAAERSGRQELAKLLQGPVAIAYGYGDIAQPARVLTEYIRTAKKLEITGGLLQDKFLSKADLDSLVTLPSREVLLARVMGGIQGPISSLAAALNSPVRAIMMALQARITQMEEK